MSYFAIGADQTLAMHPEEPRAAQHGSMHRSAKLLAGVISCAALLLGAWSSNNHNVLVNNAIALHHLRKLRLRQSPRILDGKREAVGNFIEYSVIVDEKGLKSNARSSDFQNHGELRIYERRPRDVGLSPDQKGCRVECQFTARLSQSEKMNTVISRMTGLMRQIAAILCLILIGVQTTNADPYSAPRNILFIAVDDLRNWVNYAGDYAGTVHTPNIDALAAVSTRYLNAYPTVPQCVGSRTSVMMGLSPVTHQITAPIWGTEPVYKAVYNNAALLSLPEVMSQNGYYTASTGKVFHGSLPARWDEAGPTIDQSYFNVLWDPGPDNTFLNPGVQPEFEEHPDQNTANWTVNFINTYEGTEPFFLAAGFHLPHVPWVVPQWAYDLYPIEEIVVSTPIPGDLADEPAMAVALVDPPNNYLSQYELIEYAGKGADYTRAYLASISHTDAMIGQVLAALAASPYANNTDVIFWSDHGYHLGEKFHWGKNTFWDQSVKVPLLISSPGNPNYPVGDVTSPVSLLELAPTVLDLAGVAPFPQFEGAPLHDAVNRSPVEIYFNEGRAIILPGDRKSIDYNLDLNQGLRDQAAYLLSDSQEENNLQFIPGC